MANNFVEHKDRWLQIANGEFEYSILFIKSWLPFNAWYCNNYPEHNNVDRPILEKLKVDNNLFRTRIISLLEGKDEESVYFKANLVKLHNQLEKCKVPTVADQISFNSINFRTNPNTLFTKSSRDCDFKIEFITPTSPHFYKIKIDVIKKNGGASILLYQHTKYDMSHLEAFNDFKALSKANQKILIDGFKSLEPRKKESLLVNKRSDSFLLIKEVLFVNDVNLLSQAIIEVLYRIRCILFHGEIQPNKDNLNIYEPAFYMLKIIIKSLY